MDVKNHVFVASAATFAGRTLNVRHPAGVKHALQWVLEFALEDAVGVELRFEESESNQVTIASGANKLTFPEFRADVLRDRTGATSSRPPQVIKKCSGDDLPLQMRQFAATPVIFGEPQIYYECSGALICHIDVIGNLFFVLAGCEELMCTRRDRFDRISGYDSLLTKWGILKFPVVDIWVDLLWAMLTAVWPGMLRQRRRGAICVTCDVDSPYERWTRNFLWLAAGITGAIVKRQSLGTMKRRIRNYQRTRHADYREDPYWTFEYYFDCCRRNGHIARFFLMANSQWYNGNASYRLNEPRIRRLIQSIDDSGHIVGLHAGLGTSCNARRLEREWKDLRQVLDELGVKPDRRINRQHYLSWNGKCTPDLLEAVGIEEDWSGGFADVVGFRYGTGRPFRMWSLENWKALQLKQHPIGVMECSVLDYLGITAVDAAVQIMQSQKSMALKYGGDFNLLWHNSHLETSADRSIFEHLLTP